jgi:hypothetical protein
MTPGLVSLSRKIDSYFEQESGEAFGVMPPDDQ